MHLAQLLLSDARYFEQNAQRVDGQTLSADHSIRLWTASPDDSPARFIEECNGSGCSVLHVYGPPELDPRWVRKLEIPYVSEGAVGAGRLPWTKLAQPATLIQRVGEHAVPEAVDLRYFESAGQRRPSAGTPLRYRLGTYTGRRENVSSFCELTYARLERFRDDIDWEVYESPPGPADFATLDLWVDPAAGEDANGLVGEALVTGTPVVAARNPINAQRLDEGRGGFLVPRDPNELTHAILAALFKPEIREGKLSHARTSRMDFHPSRRAARLVEIYRSAARV